MANYKGVLTGKRVLVTGGAGFIGSNLISQLLKDRNHVVCLDNLATGKRENIFPFESNPNFKFMQGDIREGRDCDRATNGIDIVFHQAALGSVPRSIKDPVTTNEVNIGGFVNVLVAARDAGAQRIVYAASSSTYGDHPGLPKEEDKIGNPLSPYAVTKYVNELYAEVFSKTYEMELVGLRYFNVFGPNQDPNAAYAAVIPIFISAVLNSETITINGDGETSRDFTFVENVVQANILAASSKMNGSKNSVYNIACGERTSLNELLQEIKRIVGFNGGGEVTYGPERAGDVRHSLASIVKAKSEIGYLPTHNFKEGMIETVAWFKQTLL